MSSYPPPGGFQGGGYTPPSQLPGKTKTLNLEYGMAGLLCYIPSCCCLLNVIPCLIWLFTEPKENRTLRFHSIQGLLLAAIWVVVYVLFFLVGLALGVGGSMVPSTDTAQLATGGASILLSLFQLVIYVVLLIFHIVGMIKANKGEMWKIPVIGGIAESKS